MTRDETIAIMGILKTAYPNFYKDMSRDSALQAIALWSEMFRDDPAEIVTAAVKALIASRTEGWPPNIGEVKAKMQTITNPDGLSEGQAWALVEKACRNGIYGYREEFDNLPPAVQKAVGTPNQLREWAILDGGELKTVVASNFMRSFRTMQKREKELALIPVDVQKLLAKTAERLMLHE